MNHSFLLPTIITFIALVLSLILQLALGRTALALFRLGESKRFSVAHSYLLGLLIHLTLAFLLRCLWLPWSWAALLPLFVTLIPLSDHSSYRDRFAIPSIDIDLNFALWLGAHIALGLTLFEARDAILTPWSNNYGDIAFHLGMISSFTLGEAGPPEFHLYPGARLSYPFFVNFWSSLYFWIAPHWYTLSVIFLFQWTVCWALIYKFLNGEKNTLIPWALLFGGGSYFLLGANSGPINDDTTPWMSFLTTVWVSQRSAIFGAVTLLATLTLVFDWLRERVDADLLLALLIVALSPLVHTHIMITGVLYGIILILSLICFRELTFRDILDFLKRNWKFITFAVLLSLTSLPWLIEKRSIVHLTYGWYGRGDTGFDKLLSSGLVWLKAGFPTFITFLLAWQMGRKHAYFLPIVIIFFIANIVQISVWEWDQIKIFIALYVIFLFLWSLEENSYVRRAQIALFFLIFPTVYELGGIFKKGHLHTVYTKKEIEIATSIREITAPDAIIAGDTRHNIAIPLSGRKIFTGYEGTLHSHGLEYRERFEKNQSLQKLLLCKPKKEVCPDYLLFTEAEKKMWKVQQLHHPRIKGTGSPYLFRVEYQ